MKINPVTAKDFYKSGHIYQYPEGTEYVYSNLTPRSDKYAREQNKVAVDFDGKLAWLGAQGVIKWLLIDYWNEYFFNRPKEEVIAEYKRRMDTSLGEGAVGTEHIEALHDLGYLPVRIKVLPEGTRVPMRVPVMTIVNTDPRFFWVTNMLETQLSAELWKTSTNATIAYEFRRILERFAEETGAPKDFVPWQGHDFSMRGMSGIFDAAQSNTGHLASFLGTDTISAIDYIELYYNGRDSFIGGSVAASEHSVMTMDGVEGELELFRRLITNVYPSGIVSLVSDGFDFFRVITEYAAILKPEILARTPNALGMAKVVFRPDSGDPVKILTGYVKPFEDIDYPDHDSAYKDAPYNLSEAECVKIAGKWYGFEWFDGHDCTICDDVELSEAEVKGAVECLWDIFGGTTTEKGYKVLHERVGLIYGDSITIERMTAILQRLKDKGFASCNSVFGIGSYTYNMNTRDTFGFAIKATFGVVKGVPRAIFKDPKTDSGTKKSAKGLLRVDKDENGEYILSDEQDHNQEAGGQLRTIFLNGQLMIDESFDNIRKRLWG